MAEAHIAVLLPTQNRVVGADENTTFLAHYDLNEHDVLRNVKAVGEKNSLSFSNAMVDCPTFNTSGLTTLSTEAWIYWDGTAGENLIYCQENVFEMKVDGGGIYIAWSPYWGWVGSSTSLLTANTWNYVTATYDGANQYIYINGVQVYSRAQTGAMISNTNTFHIGARGTSHTIPSSPFSGKIHNLRVWFRTLSASEIQQYMNIPPSTEASKLMGWWKMNEGQGMIAPDYSPYHNDGVIVNATWSTGNSVFTIRDKEGYFGGSAIAVEEGTTNLITKTDFIGWNLYGGSTVTVSQGYQDVSGGAKATRIQTSGGTDVLKYYYDIGVGTSGDPCSASVWVKNNSSVPLVVSSQVTGLSGTITQNQSWVYLKSTGTANGSSNRQMRFHTQNASDSLDFFAYQPQMETKAFSTSFTNTVRNKGVLVYPNVLSQNAGTIAMWIKAENLIMTGSGYRMPFRIANNIFEWSLYKDTMKINGSSITFPTQLSTNTWYYIAYTWSSSATDLYLFYPDGTVVTNHYAAAPPSISGQSSMWVGCGDANGNYAVNALIDELRIDNITRTQNELTAWYYSASPFWPRGIYRKPY